MPAVIETRRRAPELPEIARNVGAGPRCAPVRGDARHVSVRFKRPPVRRFGSALDPASLASPGCVAPRALDPTTPALRRARPGRRSGSSRNRSGLTFGQPFRASLAALDGPCDPGNPSAARTIGCGFPRSHGPIKGKVSDPTLTFPYRSTERPRPSIFAVHPDVRWTTCAAPMHRERSRNTLPPPTESGHRRPAMRGAKMRPARTAIRRGALSIRPTAGRRCAGSGRFEGRPGSRQFLAQGSAARDEGTVPLMSRSRLAGP
jgi:hypothetical protein